VTSVVLEITLHAKSFNKECLIGLIPLLVPVKNPKETLEAYITFYMNE